MFFVSWQQTFVIQEVAPRAPAPAKAAAGARRVKIYKVVLFLSLALTGSSLSLSPPKKKQLLSFSQNINSASALGVEQYT
jgi:hypothetical protein